MQTSLNSLTLYRFYQTPLRWCCNLLAVMRMGSRNKVSVSGLLKEYSENATIHGITYIFSAANAIEKFIWKVWLVVWINTHWTFNMQILTGLFWCVAPSPAPFTWQCETTSSGRTGRSSPVSRYRCDYHYFRYYIATDNHTSGYGQASEGYSIPQHHNLHRGYQHGRHHGSCHKRFQWLAQDEEKCDNWRWFIHKRETWWQC